MNVSTGGVILASIALAIAAFEYFVVRPIIVRSLERTAAMMPEKQAGLRRGIAVINGAFIAQFVLFPFVGYAIGRALF